MSTHDEGVQEDVSDTDWQKELECPVCLMLPRCPPVLQCKVGHIVCEECYLKLLSINQAKICPQCRSQFNSPVTRSFLAEKLHMESHVIDAANILEACWSKDSNLCVRFSLRVGATSVNKYKHNLPPGLACEDFVPPALRDLENFLVRYGDQLRASRAPGQPPIKTRSVWLNGTRVLQAKLHPSLRFQNVLRCPQSWHLCP